MAKWPAAGSYPASPKAYPASPKAYPGTINAYPSSAGDVIPGPLELLGMAGMYFWLRADDVVSSGGLITQANDKSGNGRHFTNAGGTARPSVVTVATANNQAGMQLDGVANRLDNTSITLPAPGTTPTWFWAIMRVDAWSTGELLFNAVGTNTMQMLPGGASPTLTIRNPTQVLANSGFASYPDVGRVAWEFTNTTADSLLIKSTNATGANAGNNSTTGLRIGVNNGATVFYPLTLLEWICCPGYPGASIAAQLDYYGSQRYGSALFA